ncbi:MAG: BON domain-containing protein [Syntrophaceae bacterium]|nr:BON domain-containing protein [Syntrophaceae bacterium]
MECPESKNHEIAENVLEELQWDPRVSEEDIRVTVKSGVVVLSGYTKNLLSSRAATEAAWRVAGVKMVRNDLRVRLPHKDWKQDELIAQMAKQFLDWNVLIDTEIGIFVENGWVTLTGDVNSKLLSQKAEAVITELRGVKGLSNMINIAPLASSVDTANRINKALKRNRHVNEEQIQINASKGTVKATGEVETQQQMEEILEIIWSAPGVQAVKNGIIITDSPSTVRETERSKKC